jgi:hypothetical protein
MMALVVYMIETTEWKSSQVEWRVYDADQLDQARADVIRELFSRFPNRHVEAFPPTQEEYEQYAVARGKNGVAFNFVLSDKDAQT